jgi:hypothetical protein
VVRTATTSVRRLIASAGAFDESVVVRSMRIARPPAASSPLRQIVHNLLGPHETLVAWQRPRWAVPMYERIERDEPDDDHEAYEDRAVHLAFV